jgi:hypothetical protein
MLVFLCCFFQQMESTQRAIEPLQDAILNMSKLAAKLEGVSLQEANDSLADFRKSETELRERIFICQVAKRYGWEDANKMARRKAGEFDDPELAKVLEEREKKNEKVKRDRAKFETARGTKRRYQAVPGPSRGGKTWVQYNSPLANVYNSGSNLTGGYGHRPHFKTDLKCYIVEKIGHLFQSCPDKKN